MTKICDVKKCTGCEACAIACPTNCIKMIPNFDGFYYPQIDNSVCIGCGKCIKICPVNSEVKKGNASFYMGWHKSQDVRINSSSGGAFTAISDYVLDNRGVVFGAYFDDKKHTVEHICVDNKNDLWKLRLSKYFQGRINESYKNAKKMLSDGRLVLFTGTGCQIAGLLKYLNKEYENLITVDVLCHGVTSKKVVDAYIKSKEKKYKKSVKTFRFRLKPPDSDWIFGGIRLDFTDGSRIIENKETDTFFMGFNNYLFLRESCYQCKYVGKERIADISLADYWGLDLNTISDKNRKEGVSLIIVNSDKGRNILDKTRNEMEIFPANPVKAISANQALSKPSTQNQYRNKFFCKFDYVDFDTLVHRYNRFNYLKIFARRMFGDSYYVFLKRLLVRFQVRRLK